MAITPINITFGDNRGAQTLMVNSDLDNSLFGFLVTSTFQGVTIKNDVGAKPVTASWKGLFLLDVTYQTIAEDFGIVLQASGKATRPDGTKVLEFTTLANAWPSQPS